MLRAASILGRVFVALNSDGWLERKKGFAFMPWDERALMLRECRSVSEVVPVDDQDGTVCTALACIRPDIFANGGDRTAPNRKEHLMCKRLGIREIFNVGGYKIQSSSDLIRGALGHHKNTVSG